MHPDCVIAGRYRLVRRIGVGGMSTVWEAWDERLQRRVALKQLEFRSGVGAEEGRLAADRALREARITARLHHPNAVTVFDVVDHEGAPCLVMQYLPSRTMQRLIEERGTLPVQDVTRIGGEVAAALGAAHAAGIVHRDVKPGNVLIGEDGGARLTDFGISHAFGDVTLTSSGMVTGTPAYLAPEVARGGPSSFASDVFSLGATLYTALEGTSPVGTSDNPMAVLHRVASGQITPPRRGSLLEPLLSRMLAFDPRHRPPVSEVAAELDRLHTESRNPAAAQTTDRMRAAAAPPPSTTVALPPVRPAPVHPAPVRPASPPDATPPARRRSLSTLAIVVVAALLLAGLITLVAVTLGGGSGPGGPAAADRTSRPVTPTADRHPHKHRHKAKRTKAVPPPVTPATVTKTRQRTVTTSASPPAPPAGTGPDAQMAAISDYYGLLPDDTSDAWNRLTASYQAQAGGRDGYEQFWNGFQAVTVGDESYSDGTVLADLTYTRDDGSETSETRSFRLVEEDGILKIDDSEVVG